MKLTQPIRNASDVHKLLEHYKINHHPRNHLLITLGIHTALRISDILNLNCNDVYNFANNTIRKIITITEKKSKKLKTIALNKSIISALTAYFPEATPNTPLISNPKTGRAITRVQAYRIIREAADMVGIDFVVSCHSLRKTFGYHSWTGGISPVVLMEIYNHSSYAITKRYLGITQDDQNAVYLDMNFTAK